MDQLDTSETQSRPMTVSTSEMLLAEHWDVLQDEATEVGGGFMNVGVQVYTEISLGTILSPYLINRARS
jgi:hypothetical protein